MKNSFLINGIVLLLFLFLFISGLYFAAGFLIPVVFATLLSMLLLPICRKLESKKIKRVPSILISMLLLLVIIFGIIFVFYSQISSFTSDMDMVGQKLNEKMVKIQDFVEKETGIPAADQISWVKKRYTAFLESGGPMLRSVFLGFSSILVTLGLIFIYIFFFLLYRDRFKIFILKLVREEHHIKMEQIINNTKNLILHYLSGLIIALTILGIMNSIGLLLLGIRQAIFLGFLASFMNVIPYIGTLIGSLLPILVALLFKDSIWYAVGVAAIFSFNQFIDNNITTPKVVGSHVQVNPLATIMAVIIGGIIWGIPGMILFIPMLGVFKIICDNVERLRPVGYLLGEDDKMKPTKSLADKIARTLGRKK